MKIQTLPILTLQLITVIYIWIFTKTWSVITATAGTVYLKISSNKGIIRSEKHIITSKSDIRWVVGDTDLTGKKYYLYHSSPSTVNYHIGVIV